VALHRFGSGLQGERRQSISNVGKDVEQIAFLSVHEVTQIYAEADRELAIEVIQKIGYGKLYL
jgi:hypothetical protein